MEDEKSVKLKRKIIEKGVKQLLDEARVPLRIHLQVVKQLKKATDDNAKQAEGHADKTKQHEDAVAKLHEFYQQELKGLGDTVSKAHEAHTTQIGEYQAEIDRVKGLKRGEDGLPGLNAQPVDEEALVSKVLSKVPLPEPGPKGDKGDTLALDDIITAVVKRIQKGDVLHINNVKGAGAFIKDGIRYRFEELMHGSGSSTSTSGITLIAVNGVINDSNVTFTVTTNPTLLNINGAFYKNTGGAITWTFLAGTITLSSPVGTGGNIYAVK